MVGSIDANRRAARILRTVAALTAALGVASCGGEERAQGPSTARESVDRAVKPPDGWRTVTDREAGMTISAPRSWKSERSDGATLIRSDDNAVAITIVADRSRAGRESAPDAYARQVIGELPKFKGDIGESRGMVRRSPYETAVLRARGTLRGNKRRQRVEIAVFNRPELVSYGVVVLTDATSSGPRGNQRVVERMLSSLRARPPQQRS